MNFKTMAVALVAMTIGTASCTKESVAEKTDNASPLSISITLTENVGRAVAAPVNHQATVNFSSGHVIFTNGIGVIIKVTEIVPGSYPGSPSAEEETAKAAGTKVWLEDMKTTGTGGEIKNVPAAATKVYIVGNLPTDVNAPVVSENISTVKDRVIRIASQSNLAGDVANVTLYGDGAPLLDLPSGSNEKYAIVSVNAIASRIEIGKISYKNSPSFVTSFKLDGIFVNHYYSQMSLSSMVSTALVNNTVANNTAADIAYSSSYNGGAALFDYKEGGLGYSNITSDSWQAANPDVPADKNVWAYNVLAPTSFGGTEVTALAAPHIVIRLSDFVTTGDMSGKAYPGTQYLTVKEFRKAGGTNEVIEKLAPGYIYFITNLTFNESNLTDIPEEKTVTAYVEAVLMTWTRQEVEWGY